MVITVRKLVIGGFAAAIFVTLTMEGGGLGKAGAWIASKRKVTESENLEKEKTDRGVSEGTLAWERVQAKGCIPAIGLAPPTAPRQGFVPVSMSVGQRATTGGKVRQPFGVGQLVCSRTGQVAEVGLNGKLENPIESSVTPQSLPIVPQRYLQPLTAYLDNLAAQPNTPQAVISSTDELAERAQIDQQNLVQSNNTATPVEQGQTPSELPPQDTGSQPAKEPEPPSNPPSTPPSVKAQPTLPPVLVNPEDQGSNQPLVELH